MNIYNIGKKEIKQKDVELFKNPYLRTYIRNNFISYIIEENNLYYIEIYNLITEEIKRISCRRSYK
jgi:hypothetical protein